MDITEELVNLKTDKLGEAGNREEKKESEKTKRLRNL